MTPDRRQRFLKVVFRSEAANVGCLVSLERRDQCDGWVRTARTDGERAELSPRAIQLGFYFSPGRYLNTAWASTSAAVKATFFS